MVPSCVKKLRDGMSGSYKTGICMAFPRILALTYGSENIIPELTSSEGGRELVVNGGLDRLGWVEDMRGAGNSGELDRNLRCTRKKEYFVCWVPKVAQTLDTQEGDLVLPLAKPASLELVEWLCAVLAPKPGWLSDRGGFPPWAAIYHDGPRFVLSMDEPVQVGFALNERPPTFTRATELLVELCCFHVLGPGEVADPMAAFWDGEKLHQHDYPNEADLVARTDLVRHRYNPSAPRHIALTILVAAILIR
ncbi:hypothetical protein QBC37DRAFT_400770 [Rhypophila decipiens]|uniref:Uncharacterized protein n=1 Tax=Rhypophila decipiens TaxID=261697 RepID=A0AAN6Y5X8_9PEZI|nr:hypothetical protein QBC37DRAFT_400770 [Rhypophila decipiens]